MKQKTAKAGESGKRKAVRKGAKGAGKGELSPMDRLEASIESWRKERERNPPKTDYVLPTGEMKPIPPRLLKSKGAVLRMYEHLHEYCCNPNTPYTFIHHDHAHPIECIEHMYRYGCVSLGELREFLRLPLQIRLLHERFYRPELVDVSPYRRFVVEYVEMLQFMLRLRGYTEMGRQPVRRYCYSWHLMMDMPLPENAFRDDKMAKSYENETLSNKVFMKDWGELRSMVSVKKWMYCKYQNWFLAFDDWGRVDFKMTDHTLRDGASMEGESDHQPHPTVNGMLAAIRRFCGDWSLTHLGTPIREDVEGGDVMIRAERVDVVPRGQIMRSDSGKLSASGFDVYLPKYCQFAAIPRYRKKDFEQLMYALQYGHRHRRHTSGMPWGQIKKLLRFIEGALERSGAKQEAIYPILKLLANQHRQAGDLTMRGHGFYPPAELSEVGEVKQAKARDGYEKAMECTAGDRVLQKKCQEIFRRFGIDGDICLHGMADS